MLYFLDTEFMEHDRTIDLLSIGLVCEDGREFYQQNASAQFAVASDWVWRNVFPRLAHFHMSGQRACEPKREDRGLITAIPCSDSCPWRLPGEIGNGLAQFCDVKKYGKPEFWGYYAAYDWVAFCQRFGSMVQLPKDFPWYCHDLKQWADALGNPTLPPIGENEHHALWDARWNRTAYNFLNALRK